MHVLLVEDNPGDARLFREQLNDSNLSDYSMEVAISLADAQQRLSDGNFDVILCDLTLPDSHGLATFHRLHEFAPGTPIIVLTGTSDESLAVQTVQMGAQDYLVKGEVSGPLLMRAMRYAIERHHMHEALRSLSLIDELTGLYNRRGFLALAEQQLKVAARTKHTLLLLFADLDGMKLINDTYGHAEGDRALVSVTDVLRSTLRDSDLCARIGGDEFVILALESGALSKDVLSGRLETAIGEANHSGAFPYLLSVSIGMTRFDPETPRSLDDLLAESDALMYKNKREKKRLKYLSQETA